jgi:hypothetical protein
LRGPDATYTLFVDDRGPLMLVWIDDIGYVHHADIVAVI